MVLFHAVLLVFGVSLLALALRSLFLIDGLISTALVLFTLGVLGLIAGASCILIDISQGNTSSDTLSYSLAKILAQFFQQLSRQHPLSAPINSKKLPSSIQKPDSFIN